MFLFFGCTTLLFRVERFLFLFLLFYFLLLLKIIIIKYIIQNNFFIIFVFVCRL